KDDVDLVVVAEEDSYLFVHVQFVGFVFVVVLGAVDTDPSTVAVATPAGDGAGDGAVGQDRHVDSRLIRIVATGPDGGNGVGIAAPLVTEVLQGFLGVGQGGLLAVDVDIGVVVHV